MIDDLGVAFSMSIAGRCFHIRCSYPDTRRLCRNYLVEEAEDGADEIILDRAALEQERAKYPIPESEAGLERQCLCRQIAHRLIFSNTMLFHSSALMFHGQAVLFTAPSGTGKSTHTRLWRQVYGEWVTMINDDKPFVKRTESGATVFGSPWQGKHNLGSNVQAPLKAICVICRGSENNIQQLSPRDAFPLLLQQVYRPEQPELLTAIMAWTEQISRQVPVYRLSCNMDPEAAVVACRGIFGENWSKA